MVKLIVIVKNLHRLSPVVSQVNIKYGLRCLGHKVHARVTLKKKQDQCQRQGQIIYLVSQKTIH